MSSVPTEHIFQAKIVLLTRDSNAVQVTGEEPTSARV